MCIEYEKQCGEEGKPNVSYSRASVYDFSLLELLLTSAFY